MNEALARLIDALAEKAAPDFLSEQRARLDELKAEEKPVADVAGKAQRLSGESIS